MHPLNCRCSYCCNNGPVIQSSGHNVSQVLPSSGNLAPHTSMVRVGPSGPRGPEGPTGPKGDTGPAGAPGTSASYVDSEILTGTIDGNNVVFTTASPFVSGSTRLFLNGLRQRPGGTFDYTETGADEVTFVSAPEPGDTLLIDYRI